MGTRCGFSQGSLLSLAYTFILVKGIRFLKGDIVVELRHSGHDYLGTLKRAERFEEQNGEGFECGEERRASGFAISFCVRHQEKQRCENRALRARNINQEPSSLVMTSYSYKAKEQPLPTAE